MDDAPVANLPVSRSWLLLLSVQGIPLSMLGSCWEKPEGSWEAVQAGLRGVKGPSKGDRGPFDPALALNKGLSCMEQSQATLRWVFCTAAGTKSILKEHDQQP